MSVLKDDLKQGAKFWLGKIERVHNIGEFSFLEYKDFTDQKSHFSIYINELSIGISAESLDFAMVEAIAFKYDGCNSQASYYFSKMVGDSEHKDYKHYSKDNSLTNGEADPQETDGLPKR